MIPVTTPDRAGAYAMLRAELEAFSPTLAAKPHCVAFTKGDLVPAPSPADHPDVPDAFAQFVISSVSRQGLDHFLEAVWQRLAAEHREAEAAT
jgi:GTPase involved in cell partitioning and DNA repair